MRKFAVFISATFLSLVLFMTITATATVIVVTPAHIKTWLHDSNFYDTFVDNLLSQSKTLNKDSGDGSSSNNPFNDPGVQAAAKKALTPAVLQSTTEQIIDGTTPWLEGKVSKPTFSIDLSSVKASLADNIGAYARTRYASLPVCAAGQVPDTSDVLAITCRVPNYNPEPEIQKTINDLKSSQDFLANPVVTADTLQKDQSNGQKPLFDRLSNVPKAYKWLRVSPYILGAITLLLGFILVFFSRPRRKGIRTLMGILYVVGGILLFELWAMSLGLKKTQSTLAQNHTIDSGIQTTIISIIKQIQHSLTTTLLIFAIGFLAVAFGLTIYLFLTKDKKPVRPDDAPPESEKQEVSVEKVTESKSEEKPITKPPKSVQG